MNIYTKHFSSTGVDIGSRPLFNEHPKTDDDQPGLSEEEYLVLKKRILDCETFEELDNLLAAPKKTAHCCPVCGGNGIVPRGFYLVTKGCSGMTSDASPEQCRSCNGTGIVWG